MRPLVLTIVAVLVFDATPPAQWLQVPNTPVAPGVAFNVVLINDTPVTLRFDCTPLVLVQPSGERIAPLLGAATACELLAGNRQTLAFATPTTGPGSSGSYLLQCNTWTLGQGRLGAAARLDVGAATPMAGTQVVPGWLFGDRYDTSRSLTLDVANLTASPQQITAMTVDLFRPGETKRAASTTITGLSIPAGHVNPVKIDLSSLVPAHYTVRTRWVDPVTNLAQARTFGLRPAGDILLLLPAGRTVPRGGRVPVEFYVPPMRSGRAAPFAFALGTLPGTTPLPGGDLLPLHASDPLFLTSLAGGLLPGGTGLTMTIPRNVGHNTFYAQHAAGAHIVHPNTAAAVGMPVRVVGLLIDGLAAPGIYSSQMEEVAFR